MSTLTDHQLGMKLESTFNTPVTVDRFLPFLADSSHNWDVRPVYGEGLIPASQGFQRGDRRVLPIGQGTLELKFELQSRALGVPLQLSHPTAASTLVSGATYQRVYTPQRTTLFLPSATIQVGIVRAVAAGTVDPITYAGCTVTGFEIDVPEDGIPTLTLKIDATSYLTATALATASYASAPTIYHHDNGSTVVGGTVTAPTSTALATSTGTVASNVRAWNLSIDWAVDTDRRNVGSRGQGPVREPSAELTVDIEYDATAHRDAFLAGTASSFLGNLTTTEALSTGTPTFQVAVPQVFWDEGGSPPFTKGEIVRQSLKGKVTYNGTSQPWYIAERTADTAL